MGSFARPALLSAGVVVTALAGAGVWQQIGETDRALIGHRLSDIGVFAGRVSPVDTLLLGSSSIVRLPAGAPDCGTLLNRGMGSATIADLQRYVDGMPQRLHAERVVVYAADNDAARGLDAAAIQTAYVRLLDSLLERAPPAGVHVLAVKPSPARRHLWPVLERVNTAMEGVAARDTRLHFHRAGPAEWERTTTTDLPDAARFVDDGVHLTATGYEVLLRKLEIQCQNP